MKERINGVRLHLDTLTEQELDNLIEMTAMNIEQATNELERLLELKSERNPTFDEAA